ncbi:MAG: tyrosine--tRNA ligase [Myxococcales bacterium]|nr:tyrosine--tRNA ligase [Myxococcales bacterium]
MSRASEEEQTRVFAERTVDLVSESDLRAKLRLGRPLRIKLGCDPSAPDLHLGHLVPLDQLRRYQDLGHVIVFLVGDFTARIGDPSGRRKTRPALTREQVEENAETYREQVGEVLDRERIELRFNSEWMDQMQAADLIRLASHQPVARMLERDDFERRYREGNSIGMHEFLYPLVQAYDSVALHADVEVGGTDQLFNLLLGREIQRAYGQDPQVALTFPLLVGTDGREKMSKSLGNAVGIREAPAEMYGQVMSIPDEALPQWIDLLMSDSGTRISQLKSESISPRDQKAALAYHLVARFQGEPAASEAEAHFDRVFRQHQPPAELPEVEIASNHAEGPRLVDLLVEAGFAPSRSEAKRLVVQGGVQLDAIRAGDPQARVEAGSHLVQVGRRRFTRVRVRIP